MIQISMPSDFGMAGSFDSIVLITLIKQTKAKKKKYLISQHD